MRSPVLFIPTLKTLSHLEQSLRMKRADLNTTSLRKKVSIAVIDDQAFQPQTNLQNHHFSLKHFSDITDIHIVEPFQVILCDLQGVGKFLNAELQGAHIIREIKTQYPDKVVISYTGGSAVSTITKQGNLYADMYIKKDADIPTWLDKLDSAIRKVTDPVEVWETFRERLIVKHKIPLLDVVYLEDAYVKACITETSGDAEKAMRRVVKSAISDASRKPLEEFIKSPGFKIAVQIARIYLNGQQDIQ